MVRIKYGDYSHPAMIDLDDLINWIYSEIGYLGMTLEVIEKVFNNMISIRKKCVHHILYFGFWEPMWTFLHSVVSMPQYG